jgi:hypothetical protein
MPNRHRFIASVHVATMLCGAGMCVGGSEDIGILLLCASMVFLTAICVGDLEHVDLSITYSGGLEGRLFAAEQAIASMSRRSRATAELLKCVESTPSCEHLHINTRLRWVLDHLESDDTHVDTALHALRDDVLTCKRTALSAPHR